jgi:hypothetical protein
MLHDLRITLVLKNSATASFLCTVTSVPFYVQTALGQRAILTKFRHFFQSLSKQLRSFDGNNNLNTKVNYNLTLSNVKIQASSLEILEILQSYAVPILMLPSAVYNK